MDINAKIEATPPVAKGKPRVVYAVDGLSAYEIAVKHGFEGTEEAWLNSIVRGEPGYTPVLGKDFFNGKDGVDGLSAYEIAKNHGFEGTEEEWLESVVYGADGKDGLSAFDIAKKYNPSLSTEAQWLASLKGADGENGGAFYNDEITFEHDNPTLGTAYTVRAESYPFVEFSKYKKGNVYSRVWNNTDGTRRGTALLKYEGTTNNYYTFTLISLINDGKGVLPKLRINADTHYWEVSYNDGETWESTNVEATGEQGLQGIQGNQGDEGKSAYKVACENGFEGTVEEWLDYLNGFTKSIMTINDGFLRVFVGSQEEYADVENTENLFAIITNDSDEATFEYVLSSTFTQGLAYTLSSNEDSYICSGIGTATDTDIVIPSKYNGLPVTSIANNAFKGLNITSVDIPGSVTDIGEYAFYECASLENVAMSNGVKNIGYHAFSKCTELTSIKLPRTIESIGGLAFSNCSKLRMINIPSSTTTIGNFAFNRCFNLTIYCEAETEGNDWGLSWNEEGLPVYMDTSAPDVVTSAHAGTADRAKEADGDLKELLNIMIKYALGEKFEGLGVAKSSSLLTIQGYPVQIEIPTSSYGTPKNPSLSSYSYFNSEPTASLDGNTIIVRGHSDTAEARCSATVTYTLVPKVLT